MKLILSKLLFRHEDMQFSRAGFTLIEAAVTLAIIVTISAVVLFSFSGFTGGAALNRSIRELALAVRKTQNMSLAVRQIDTPSGPVIPLAVGMQMNIAASNTYFVFADILRNNKYDAGSDVKIGSNETFERNVRISSLTDQAGAPQATVHIMFAAPEAAMTLADGNGASIGEKIDVRLTTPTGSLTKKMTVRTSGQVSIQ